MQEQKTANSCQPRASPKSIALIMYMLLLSGYFLNAMDRQLFALLATDVQAAMNLELKHIGVASTIFTLGMGISGLFTALMFRHMPRKAVALTGMVTFSLATGLTAYVTHFHQLLTLRFFSGVGESMQIAALLAIGSSYFHKNRGLAVGAITFTFGLGSVIGPNVAALMLHSHSWHAPFIWLSVTSLVVVITVTIFAKPWFTEFRSAPASQSTSSSRAQPRLRDASTPSTYILMACTALAGLIIYGYLGLYPTYLRTKLGFSPDDAALAASCYGLGAFFSLAGGWVGDRTSFRKLVTAAFFITATSGAMLFSGITHSVTVHALLSFIFGVAASGIVFVNLATALARSVKPSYAASIGSIYITCFYGSAAVSGYMLTALHENLGWTHAGFIQLSGLSVLGAVLVFFVTTPLNRGRISSAQ